ncbi:TPA: porphobilinogen synthase [Enterococcus faecalis]|uniref:porphobilinogen synthase n=1 Tax=Enterococcus faecalis TaxID=1351 RepID=UPI0011438F47|nr:porphobilinogen synthase [Enterococcus faecalis]EHV0153387.1 porphobilinogen synthase [Enterococcus faecalis]NSV46800.1 porphobilinogen synthase [Enterococcus faecalis]TQA42053.1 porphobilinogen synthase [Enterococcus faecalis]HDT8169894.1 porphobilinogen synthase [Enterococcus faecalis]
MRHRRLRQSATMRDMVRENQLLLNDLIYPMFVKESGHTSEISSMPGIYQYTLEDFTVELDEIHRLGIKAILLFGIPDHKDSVGTEAYHSHGIVQEAIRISKKKYPDILVIADTCLCEYTDHGHCGVVENGVVQNDASLALLVKTAVSQAESGADIIAPSNAMDGFVLAIREGLNEAGFTQIPIMSYAVKYASSFYGPFRDAADSAPKFGDRKSYQMDPANGREAMRELESDIKEGADMFIIKPSMSFLDVVKDAKTRTEAPIVCYNVSGEYSMVKAASQNGWIDEERVVNEMLVSMKRAGADMIMTYFAKDIANRMKEVE